jgi:hypothetical protein
MQGKSLPEVASVYVEDGAHPHSPASGQRMTGLTQRESPSTGVSLPETCSSMVASGWGAAALRSTARCSRKENGMDGTEKVFRKTYLTVFAILGALGLTAILIFTPYKNASDAYIAAPVFGILVYAIWLVGWHSSIRVNDSDVTVDNIFVRHVVPLADVSGIDVEQGLSVKVSDGSEIGSIMFGGSVIGEIFRYRYTNKVSRRIKSEIRRRRLVESKSARLIVAHRKGINIPWIPLLAIVASAEMISLIASALR